MKVLMFILITATMLIGCQKSGNEKAPAVTPKSQLTVLVYDISKSTDAYAMLTDAHIEKIYNGIGKNGGGKFYGLHIQSNSLKQDPITADVPALEQIEIKGNAYQQENRERKNRQLAETFENGKDTFVTTISQRMILPKNQNFSDIKNALNMARIITENPAYDNFDKKLIIISDMDNDLPPEQGIDKMQPVHFGRNVKILLVRPYDGVDISEMMPGSTVYVTIHDAINSLFSSL